MSCLRTTWKMDQFGNLTKMYKWSLLNILNVPVDMTSRNTAFGDRFNQRERYSRVKRKVFTHLKIKIFCLWCLISGLTRHYTVQTSWQNIQLKPYKLISDLTVLSTWVYLHSPKTAWEHVKVKRNAKHPENIVFILNFLLRISSILFRTQTIWN